MNYWTKSVDSNTQLLFGTVHALNGTVYTSYTSIILYMYSKCRMSYVLYMFVYITRKYFVQNLFQLTNMGSGIECVPHVVRNTDEDAEWKLDLRTNNTVRICVHLLTTTFHDACVCQKGFFLALHFFSSSFLFLFTLHIEHGILFYRSLFTLKFTPSFVSFRLYCVLLFRLQFRWFH